MNKQTLLYLYLLMAAFLFSACERETVDAIDLTFTPNITISSGIETKGFFYANQPCTGKIALDLDTRNEAKIETSFLTESTGYMLIGEEKKKILPGESFVHDYRQSSLPFELYLTTVGRNAVTLEFNSDSYQSFFTDTIVVKDLFYEITADSIPERILIGQKFSFLLNITPKEETDIQETTASATISKGAGTVYVQNDVILVNKPSEEFTFITPENVNSKAAAGSPDTKAPVTAMLSIGKNTLTYLPQDDKQNEILMKINNPYNSSQDFSLAFDVEKPIFATEAIIGKNAKPYVSKDFSFLLKVSQVDVYEGNSYSLSYRHLTPTSAPTLKVNAQDLKPGGSLDIKEGENIMILNSPTKENYEIEFIVTDQFGSQYKDTANIQFQPIPLYNITVPTTTGGTVTGAGTYEESSMASLIAKPETGYNFTGWWDKENNLISSNLTYSFTVSEPQTINARFAKQVYQVDVTAGEGGIATGSGKFEFGTNVTVRAIPNNGYSFANWVEGGSNVSNTALYMFEATKPRSLVATFKKNEIAASVDKPSQDVKVGQEAGIQLSIAEDNYEGLFSVRYELVSGTGTFSGGEKQTVGAGRHAMNFVPSTAGTHTYRLIISDQYEASKTVNVTVTATLAPIVLQPNLTTFNLSLNQEAEIQLNASEIAYNDKFTLRYDLTGANGDFKVNNVLLGNGLNTSISTGKTTLKFQIKQVGDANLKLSVSDTRGQTEVVTIKVNASSTISVTAGTGGTATGGGTFNTLDAMANLSASPNTGYLFDGWYESGAKVSGDANYSFQVTVSRAIEARFIPDSYQINTTANPASGGTVSGAGSYNYNTQQAVTATPATGYSFAGWYEGSTLVSNSTVYPFTVTNARTLEARFSINSYQLNVVANPAEGGTVSGSGTFQYGSQQTITATPNTANYYIFTGWNDGNMSLSRIVTVGASDATYTATFIYDPPKPKPVYCKINGSGTVKINGSPLVDGTPYPPGTYTLTAHPSSGWSSSWTSKVITITDREVRESVTFTDNRPKATITITSKKGASYGPSMMIWVYGGGDIVIGESCTISTSADETTVSGQKYQPSFDGWYQDGKTRVSINTNYTFTVTGNASFEARWSWK